ncbi:MAG: helix-turn-helix domain-containing protein, partial [Pseudomonadota bacterium]
VQPTLRALSRAKGPQIVRYNAASENVPARTRSFLFGHRNSPTDRAPALADSTIHLLAIEAPEGLSPALQQRLAEALKSGSFRAPGTKRTIFLGPRIVLITNMATLLSSQTADDLTAIGLDPALAEVMAGWVLRLPPVRERIDDLMQLITHASEQDLGRSLARAAFSAAATSLLQSHRWPGNDQELTSLVGHLCGHGAGHPLQIEDIRPLLDSETVASTADRSEKDWILEALWRHGFNRSKTAAALGISRKTLYNKIRKYNLSG